MRRIVIANAVIWSAVLLLASYFFKDHEYYDIFFGFWVVGFTLVNGFLSVKRKNNNK